MFFYLKNWSMRWKMAALLALASTVPLFVISLVTFHNERQLILRNGADILGARGDQMAGELDAFHQAYRRSASRMSQLPYIVRYVRSSEGRIESEPHARAILEVWQNSDPDFRGTGVLDAQGTVLLATEKALEGRNLSFYSHVQEVLRGAPVISNIYFSGSETGFQPTIAYLAPVRGVGNETVGVIALWVKVSALWNKLETWNGKAGEGSFSVLFDSFGIRIAHSYSKDIMFHPGGKLDSAVINEMVSEKRFGEKTREFLESPWNFPQQFDMSRSVSVPSPKVFRGFAPVNQKWNYGVPRRLEAVPWTLFYMVPGKTWQAPVRSLAVHLTLLSALIILLAFGGGALLANTIVEPVRKLSGAAEAMTQGRLDVRVAMEGKDELARLGAGFDRMAERLETVIESEKRLNKELEAFSYSVSHDLRAPLRHVNGFIDLLREKLPRELDKQTLHYMDTISDSSKRMGALIDELLAFSKIGRTDLRTSRVRLDTIVREVLRLLEGDSKGRIVEWNIKTLPEVECDPAMMQLVFSNLIGNALKFTRGRETASIEIGTSVGKPGQVVIFVRDNGAGFDMKYADKLFGTFQRLHSDDEFEGTGIGLANVHRIVSRHGGEVWANAEVDKGATFYFSLPVKH